MCLFFIFFPPVRLMAADPMHTMKNTWNIFAEGSCGGGGGISHGNQKLFLVSTDCTK